MTCLVLNTQNTEQLKTCKLKENSRDIDIQLENNSKNNTAKRNTYHVICRFPLRCLSIWRLMAHLTDSLNLLIFIFDKTSYFSI